MVSSSSFYKFLKIAWLLSNSRENKVLAAFMSLISFASNSRIASMLYS